MDLLKEKKKNPVRTCISSQPRCSILLSNATDRQRYTQDDITPFQRHNQQFFYFIFNSKCKKEHRRQFSLDGGRPLQSGDSMDTGLQNHLTTDWCSHVKQECDPATQIMLSCMGAAELLRLHGNPAPSCT